MVKDVDFYCQLPFSIELRKRGDKYVLWLRELNLVEADADLGRAHSKLESAKREAYRRLLEVAEDESEIPTPVSLGRQHYGSGSRNFLMRPIVATIVIVFAAWMSIPRFIQMATEDMAKELRRQTPRICEEMSASIVVQSDRFRNWRNQNPQEFRDLIEELNSACVMLRSGQAQHTKHESLNLDSGDRKIAVENRNALQADASQVK